MERSLDVEQLSIDLDAALGERPAPAPGLRLTGEQREAVRRRGEPILLSAAAGSGKTSVLVERFVQAVCDDGVAPAAVLAITFTERAAGELRARVRARLLELGDREAARDTEAAFIGTFHGFCARLLRTHPLPAGLGPAFEILDAPRAARLRGRAYDAALAAFLAGGEPGAVDLLAAYGVDVVRATVEQLHAELRSRGERRPRLPVRAPDGRGSDSARDEADALAAVALLDRLLELFGIEYERVKGQLGAVDFDDLELIAGELLEGTPTLRESWSERFELLMVDEFQDTNPRQLAILRSLDRGNLFTVGDELQSIYGFRHADVRLFQARHAELAAAGGALALRSNFRSRGEVLDAVNAVFAQRFEGFTPLVHAREEPDAGSAGAAPAVELLVTSPAAAWSAHEEEIAAGLPYAPLPRRAEARLLAQRVRELVDAGEAQPGEVVVLLRATGDIETFERALQLQGLRTLASVGAFWRRQQIADLHSYLRAVANPRDEEALYATLASPLAGAGGSGGCSRDGLALIAEAARAQGVTAWEAVRALCAAGGGELGDADRAVLSELCPWFERERAGAGGRGISQLLERAIARSGYAEHVLSLDWGERRLANVHKLLRLARGFEAQEGRDLRAFVDHLDHLREAAASEPEAPVEGVEPDTVRLMTVHTAKGLEFPVVCVADLGRRPPSPKDRVFVDGARLGLRLRRPGEGEGVKTLDFEELRDEQRRRERLEEDRVFYVAMTRARDRLLLSGVADFPSWPEEGEGTPPINWIGPALCPELATLGEQGGGGVHTPAGAEGRSVRVTLSEPAGYGSVLRAAPAPPAPGAEAEPAPGAEANPAPAAEADPAPEPSGGPERPAVASEREPRTPARSVGAPALPPTLSYTALALLERCGYRYYLERVLRMPEGDARGSGSRAEESLEARARGVLVHRLLETFDYDLGTAPDAARVGAVAGELGLAPTTSEREQLAMLLASALQSPFAARVAAAKSRRPEHPFAFGLGLGMPLVTGVIDLLCTEPDGALLVVDYKSDRLAAEQDTETLAARDYGVQRLLYALAALREGALAVEIAHWFLERPREVATARYTLAERPSLEADLAARLAADWAEPFAVSPRPHRSLCEGCPGRGSLCSWSIEETMREDPVEPSGTAPAGRAAGP